MVFKVDGIGCEVQRPTPLEYKVRCRALLISTKVLLNCSWTTRISLLLDNKEILRDWVILVKRAFV